MYPTHLLPPTLRRAAQLLALDAMANDSSLNPYTIALDEVLDREFGYWRAVPDRMNLDWPTEVLCEAGSTCQDLA
jgi:hypothetical protein